MNSRFLFLGGLGLLAFTTGAMAAPGPVTIVNLTNSPSSMPALLPSAAPSAPAVSAVDPATAAKTSSPDQAPAATTAPLADPAPKTTAKNSDPAPATTATPATAGTTAPAAPATPAAKPGPSVLDAFISDLSDAVKLSDDEKKQIEGFYQADDMTVQKILDDATLTPRQQAEQVANLRDERDTKIEALLEDPARQRAFYQVEANYRVALTEFAADSAPAPTPAAPAAPPPAPAAAK